MSQTSDNNQLEALLKLTAQRMGTTPQALKNAAQRGDFSHILGNANSQENAALKKVLSDPEAAKNCSPRPRPKSCSSFSGTRANKPGPPEKKGALPWTI